MQTHTTAASEKKEREKKKPKVSKKEAEEPSLAKEKHKIQDCGQKRTLLGGPKDAKKKQLSKGNDGSQKGSFRPYHPDKGAGKDYFQNKGKGYSPSQKNSKKEAHPQHGLSASETPEEERYTHSWESDDWSSSQWPDESWTPAARWCRARDHSAWMAVPSLNLASHPAHWILHLGCTRSFGSISAIKRFQKHCHYNKSFVVANSETESCRESFTVHFPTTPPCATTVDVLETSDAPILFSLPQKRNLGTTVELDPQGDKIT